MPSSKKSILKFSLIILALFSSCSVPFNVAKYNAMKKAQKFCTKNEGIEVKVVIERAAYEADRYLLLNNDSGIENLKDNMAKTMKVSYGVPLTCAAHCEYQIKSDKTLNGEVWFGCN